MSINSDLHNTNLDQNYMEIEDELEVSIYPKRGISIKEGANCTVTDNQGRTYIDCVSGIGVANIGHSHPKLVEAITKQAETLITCPEIFYNETRARLLKKLVQITPTSLNRVYLCNSGTESVEAAIKFARLTTGKTDIISLMRGFHGRTLGSLSATFNPKYRKPFEPLLPGVDFVPSNKFEKLEEKVTDDTAAIIMELVQGNGGVHVADQEYLEQVRALCYEKGIVLIFDEVQTGFGRTGTMFAFEQFNVVPDILCLAKSMGGGFPIGATITSEKIMVKQSLHGSTFGGNPLACAAALATSDRIEDEDLLRRADSMGVYFSDKLKSIDLPIIREIRQLGLMIGIELRKRVYPFIEKLLEQGILVNPAGSTVIRLLPPLTISTEQIDSIIEKLKYVLSQDNDQSK